MGRDQVPQLRQVYQGTFVLYVYRLITGGRDGLIKIWNYNNGHCLKVLQKGKIQDDISKINVVWRNL